EALFTIDEETGMTGAKGLEEGLLEGEILLNLDTEEDDEIGIGCAGGVDVTAKRTYSQEDAPEDAVAFNIKRFPVKDDVILEPSKGFKTTYDPFDSKSASSTFLANKT
ncbi:hypothetical protein LCGC14_1192350, partial [marine sediment metagenome]